MCSWDIQVVQKGYKLIDPATHKILISWHVIFYESVFPFSKNPLPATCYDFDFLHNIVFPTPANTFTNDHSYPPSDTSLHHHHTHISLPIATDHHCPDTLPNPHPDIHPDTHPSILTDSPIIPDLSQSDLMFNKLIYIWMLVNCCHS